MLYNVCESNAHRLNDEKFTEVQKNNFFIYERALKCGFICKGIDDTKLVVDIFTLLLWEKNF